MSWDGYILFHMIVNITCKRDVPQLNCSHLGFGTSNWHDIFTMMSYVLVLAYGMWLMGTYICMLLCCCYTCIFLQVQQMWFATASLRERLSHQVWFSCQVIWYCKLIVIWLLCYNDNPFNGPEGVTKNTCLLTLINFLHLLWYVVSSLFSYQVW